VHNVIVTGGSRGLGLGIARTLVAAGYSVIAIARSESSELTAAIEEAQGAAIGALGFRAFDLSDTAGIPALVRNLRKEFGPLYGLVNNAGLGTSGILASMRDEQIARLVQLNTISPFILTKYVVRSMMANPVRGGRIVNISSVVSLTGYSGLSVYSGTKASLVGFTRSLAREVGQLGINVNAIAPGFVDTDMTEELGVEHRGRLARRSALRRLIDVEDVANSVEFLLGDGARNITGTLLTVDAGSTA
jgi:3-oxoacyl-[acyl-carrier protein] reductase